jgi:hypothetical protein
VVVLFKYLLRRKKHNGKVLLHCCQSQINYVYKANYSNNARRKGNSDTYKYRCEALGLSHTLPTPFTTTGWTHSHLFYILWDLTLVFFCSSVIPQSEHVYTYISSFKINTEIRCVTCEFKFKLFKTLKTCPTYVTSVGGLHYYNLKSSGPLKANISVMVLIVSCLHNMKFTGIQFLSNNKKTDQQHETET